MQKSVLLIFVIWLGLSFSIQAQTTPVFTQLGPYCQGDISETLLSISDDGTLTETTPPNPGLQLDVANVCSSTDFFNLNDLLATSGADLGGVWTVDTDPVQPPPAPPIPDINGVIDISSSGNLPAFFYTYTVGNNTCSDSADYLVQVLPSPTIVLDTICISETQFDLEITIIDGVGGPYDVSSTAFTDIQVATNSIPLPAITLPNNPPTLYSISATDQSNLMCNTTLIFDTPSCVCPSITTGINKEYICSEDTPNDLLSFFPTITNPNGNFIVWVTDITDPVNTQYNNGVLINTGCSPDTIVYHAMIQCDLADNSPIPLGWIDLNYEHTVYVYPNDISSFVTTNGAGTCMTSLTIDPSCQTFIMETTNTLSQTATVGFEMGIHTYQLAYDFGISGISCITPNPFIIEIMYDCPVQCTNLTTPVFTQLGPYCQNDNPGVLPAISDNGITGSWDQPINTAITGSTTYTFTPDDPLQCSTTTTMTVDVLDYSCPLLLYVPGVITNNLYQASYNLYSDGGVSNTPVTFHANNYIDLLPNFDVPLNTQFTADIKPCGTTP